MTAHINLRRLLLLSLLITILLGSCQPKPTHTFEIAVMGELLTMWPEMGYDLETSWPDLKKAYPSKVVYTITAQDIVTYDWEDQTILLSAEATDAIEEKLGDCEPGYFDFCLNFHGFVVVYDGTPLYGGLFQHNAPIQSPFSFPIIYVMPEREPGEFAIRPTNTGWMGDFTAEEWQPIRDERIKSLFEELNKTGDLNIDPGYDTPLNNWPPQPTQ